MARRGGRPRKANRARRPTTRAGRSPADRGTEQLRRLRQALTGRLDLPPEPLSVLYSRGFISQPQYDAGLAYAGLTRLVRSGWGLQDASVAGIWGAVTNGFGIVMVAPGAMNGHEAPAVSRARQRLEEMRAELLRDDPSRAILQVVDTVCVDGVWVAWLKRIVTKMRELPGDWRSLGDLKEGLFRLAEFHALVVSASSSAMRALIRSSNPTPAPG
jgi:hypothetical protein